MPKVSLPKNGLQEEELSVFIPKQHLLAALVFSAKTNYSYNIKMQIIGKRFKFSVKHVFTDMIISSDKIVLIVFPFDSLFHIQKKKNSISWIDFCFNSLMPGGNKKVTRT